MGGCRDGRDRRSGGRRSGDRGADAGAVRRRPAPLAAERLAAILDAEFSTKVDPGKRPIREIVGVDPRLNQRWSTRRRHINLRRGELAVQFQTDHRRPPTAVEALQLAQQANLETRDAKHEPRSEADQRQVWMAEAAAVLGSRTAVDIMIAAAQVPTSAPGQVVDAAWVGETAIHILAVMEATRATWQIWHVRAEAERQVRTVDLPAEQSAALVDLLVSEVIDHHSIALTAPPDGIEEPAELRRTDGSSVCTVAGADRYTSRRILDAEQRLLAAAGQHDGTVVDTSSVDLALLELAANGTELDHGQAALVREMCMSGARTQLAIAPAGAGKTTAMRALTLAWAQDGGQVIGLAPSAAAAAVLAEQTGIHTDTMAKLIWSLQNGQLPDWAATVGPSTLIIIDEAGMADTLSLDAAVRFALDRGASVRLIGDDQQLAAIGAGGVLRDIKHVHGALQLTEPPNTSSDPNASPISKPSTTTSPASPTNPPGPPSEPTSSTLRRNRPTPPPPPPRSGPRPRPHHRRRHGRRPPLATTHPRKPRPRPTPLARWNPDAITNRPDLGSLPRPTITTCHRARRVRPNSVRGT